MARKKKFDFSNVQSYKRCEEGIHTAKLIQLDEKETQNGDDMLAATFEVIKGDSKDARVFDNFVLTDKALWKFKSALIAMGVKAEGKINLDLDNLIGKTCDIEVAHEEYNGQLRARILGYSKAVTADIEDDDEEEVEEETVEEKPKKPAKKKEEPKQEKPAKKEAPKKELNEDEDDDWEDDEDWEED